LGSGSSGNAMVVETREGRLLVDAGFGIRELERRLRAVGVSPSALDAVLLTHEHGDHCRAARRLAQRYRLPVYASAGTLFGAGLRGLERAIEIRPGQAFELLGLLCEPVLLPHDAHQPVGVVLEDRSGRRLGLIADCGRLAEPAWSRFLDLETLVVEANHDLEMLRTGPYPWALKRRVAGPLGHLSNREAADGVASLAGDRLRQVVLYHLSRTNNLPALARAALSEELVRVGCHAQLVLTEQHATTAWLQVDPELTRPGGT
jgi:phosphoribosyl 1,2-cyclic phosphodiesterase